MEVGNEQATEITKEELKSVIRKLKKKKVSRKENKTRGVDIRNRKLGKTTGEVIQLCVNGGAILKPILKEEK